MDNKSVGRQAFLPFASVGWRNTKHDVLQFLYRHSKLNLSLQSVSERINTKHRVLLNLDFCFSAGQSNAAKFQHYFKSNTLESSLIPICKSPKTVECVYFLEYQSSIIHLANSENLSFI